MDLTFFIFYFFIDFIVAKPESAANREHVMTIQPEQLIQDTHGNSQRETEVLRQEEEQQRFRQADNECDENWKAGNSKNNAPKDCKVYSSKGWCNKHGGYGPNWDFWDWGNFGKYANKAGKTAMVCPQCGCREDGHMQSIAKKEIQDFLKSKIWHML